MTTRRSQFHKTLCQQIDNIFTTKQLKQNQSLSLLPREIKQIIPAILKVSCQNVEKITKFPYNKYCEEEENLIKMKQNSKLQHEDILKLMNEKIKEDKILSELEKKQQIQIKTKKSTQKEQKQLNEIKNAQKMKENVKEKQKDIIQKQKQQKNMMQIKMQQNNSQEQQDEIFEELFLKTYDDLEYKRYQPKLRKIHKKEECTRSVLDSSDEPIERMEKFLFIDEKILSKIDNYLSIN